MNVGSIAGGTHAGWRKVRPAHRPWSCLCQVADLDSNSRVLVCKTNPGWRGKCDDCGEIRPT